MHVNRVCTQVPSASANLKDFGPLASVAKFLLAVALESGSPAVRIYSDFIITTDSDGSVSL